PQDPIDLHVIGHSRGVSVVNLALAILYGDPSIPEQMKIGFIEDTMLDPHPANVASNSQASVSSTPVGGIFGSLLAAAADVFDGLSNDPNEPVPDRVDEAEVYYQDTQAPTGFGLPGSVFNLWGEMVNMDAIPSGRHIIIQNLRGLTDHTHIHD